MKPIDTKNLDQTEASVMQSQLGLHAAQLRALLAQTAAETIQAPALTTDVLANLGLLTGHCTELEHRLGESAPTFNPPQSQAAPVTGTKTKTDTKKLTLDGQVREFLDANPDFRASQFLPKCRK